MPLKFNKEVSTHLFKYIRNIDIKFNRECFALGTQLQYLLRTSLCQRRNSSVANCFLTAYFSISQITAFDSRTRSARELLRQVQAKRFSKANPKLKIEIDAHNRPDAPLASFKFIDETEVSLVSCIGLPC
jgi:hypothetical protein